MSLITHNAIRSRRQQQTLALILYECQLNMKQNLAFFLFLIAFYKTYISFNKLFSFSSLQGTTPLSFFSSCEIL